MFAVHPPHSHQARSSLGSNLTLWPVSPRKRDEVAGGGGAHSMPYRLAEDEEKRPRLTRCPLRRPLQLFLRAEVKSFTPCNERGAAAAVREREVGVEYRMSPPAS